MPEKLTLSALEHDLIFFSKMYDAVRLVDPVHKKVLEYQTKQVKETEEICYDYWKNGKICDNCISVRAYNENKSFMKLEQKPDKIMLVTAIPIESEEGTITLELLKNATDSLMIGSGTYQEGQMMRHVIHDINSMVVMDHLTDVYNRRFVEDRLPVDIVKATLAHQPLSVIFIDVDNLKVINDTYGHDMGDFTLQQVANAMKACTRAETDWVARYGGDEFVVCLNSADEVGARNTVERIKKDIDAVKIPVENETVKITASFGIQSMTEMPLTAEELIKMADKKMYEAKRASKTSAQT